MKLASIRPHITFWALRLAWVLAAALWGLALVPWFRTPETLPPEPVRLAMNGASPQFQFPSRDTEPPPVNDKPEPAFVPQRPRTEPTEAAPERAPRTEVCGFNESGAAQEGQAAAYRVAHVARQAQLGLHVAFDELRARGEPQAQAAAWWLRVVWSREGGDTMQPCAPGADCPGGAPAQTLPAVAVAVDALAQLALASSDAWTAQVAARACDTPTPSAVCSSLPPRRWVTLEPDNAAAWLEQSTRDTGPVDEALQRALRASRFETHHGRLAAWVLQGMPERAPPLQRYAAWQRAEELERAADAKALANMARHCSDSARRDSAQRAQLCDSLARWLQPEAARTETPSGARAYDCPTIERQWREARDAAQRGGRAMAQAAQQPR